MAAVAKLFGDGLGQLGIGNKASGALAHADGAACVENE